MILCVTPEIFSSFPDAVLGVVVVHGIDNSREGNGLLADLRRQEERVRATFAAGVSIPDHPHIAPWRQAYRRFGAKPKDYPSSIENLVRRVSKGHSLPAGSEGFVGGE